MDWGSLSERISEYVKNYRYVLLIVLAGIILMALPEKEAEENAYEKVQEQATVQMDLEVSLAQILSKIEGAGKVEVLLTQAAGERTLYQTDETLSSRSDSEETRRDTVMISGSDRQEKGLIKQVIPPTYLGAIIVCQGANQAAVRLSIMEAVMSVTGLTSDKITVLKMK